MRALFIVLIFATTHALAEHGQPSAAGGYSPSSRAFQRARTLRGEHPALLADPALYSQTRRFRFRGIDVEAAAQVFCNRGGTYVPIEPGVHGGYRCGNFANGMLQELNGAGLNAFVMLFGCRGEGQWRHAINVVEISDGAPPTPTSHTFCTLEPQRCRRGPCWTQNSLVPALPEHSDRSFWNDLQAMYPGYRGCIASGNLPFGETGIYPRMPEGQIIR